MLAQQLIQKKTHKVVFMACSRQKTHVHSYAVTKHARMCQHLKGHYGDPSRKL